MVPVGFFAVWLIKGLIDKKDCWLLIVVNELESSGCDWIVKESVLCTFQTFFRLPVTKGKGNSGRLIWVAQANTPIHSSLWTWDPNQYDCMEIIVSS